MAERTVSLDAALAVFDDRDDPAAPLTAAEVADELGCVRRTAYDKLDALAERGDLATKKVGARSRVWWRPGGDDGDDHGRYRTLLETMNDGVYTVDSEGRFREVNRRYCEMLGYDREELVGEPVTKVVTEETVGAAREREAELQSGEQDVVRMEAKLERADGTTFPSEASFALFENAEGELERIGVARDVTERRERERELRRQRERLTAHYHLTQVVQSTIHAVLQQSTREEIEELVCEQLAEADSYEFAWLGGVNEATDTVTLRAEAGVENYLDGTEIRTDDTARGRGPTGRAVRTGEPRVARNVTEDPEYEPWQERARDLGFRSSAAIPVRYDGSLYGVLNVYTTRSDAFGDEELSALTHLGEVVGHAINAIERREAVLTDRVLELEYRSPPAPPLDELPDDPITTSIDRTIRVGEGDVLQYVSATGVDPEDARDAFRRLPAVEEVGALDSGGAEVHARLRLTDDSVVELLADNGGRPKTFEFGGEGWRLVAEVPPSVDVSHITEAVQSIYPDAELASKRTVERTVSTPLRLHESITERLTARQRIALETAFISGYFEWPREGTGEDVADALGVTPSTFHYHLRTAQRKLLETLFEGRDPSP